MKRLKILFLTILTLAIFAGVFVVFSANAEALQPWNVVCDVIHEEDVYHYNLRQEIRGKEQEADKRGFFCGSGGKRRLADKLLDMQLPAEAAYEYVLPGFKNMVDFFRFVSVEKQDATVSFDKSGFCFTKGVDGVCVDIDKLFDLLLKSGGNHTVVQLPLSVDRAVSVADLQKNTVKKASFTTYFAASGANRCHNVALATESLNGVTVGVGERFSFNEIVGPRTEQNGYKNAKVILDGMYTEGVGGGVCQVSTTLYNALLLSEIIPLASQHSLVSSYVLSGFDAMVSYGGADLAFTNQTEHPLYIEGKTDLAKKCVTFTIYGQPNKYKVVRESVEERTKFDTVEIVDAQKYPELVYIDQFKVVTGGSDGVKSKSYLLFFEGEKLVERRLIRQNSYKKVDKVIARGALPRPLETEQQWQSLKNDTFADFFAQGSCTICKKRV